MKSTLALLKPPLLLVFLVARHQFFGICSLHRVDDARNCLDVVSYEQETKG